MRFYLHLFLLISFISSLGLFSCKKTLDCPNDIGEICVRNTSKTGEVFVYRWSDQSGFDTLQPGECATKTAEVKVEESLFKREASYVTVSLITYNGTLIQYDLDRCYKEFEAQMGYIDLQRFCDNGKYDVEEGELGIDCGGDCKPCEAPSYSCNVDQNYMEWSEYFNSGSAEYPFISDRSGVIRATWDVAGSYKITADIQLEDLPEGTMLLTTGSDPNQVQLKRQNSWGDNSFAVRGQELYLEKNGDIYTLVFCDLDWSVSGEKIQASARLELEEL